MLTIYHVELDYIKIVALYIAIYHAQKLLPM